MCWTVFVAVPGRTWLTAHRLAVPDTAMWSLRMLTRGGTKPQAPSGVAEKINLGN